MKSVIRGRALELGFDGCRFTTAQPPDSAGKLQRWLAAGRHGEMTYLQRNAHKRLEPGLVLAGARSIITLGVSYAAEETGPISGAAPGGQRTGRPALLESSHGSTESRPPGLPLVGEIARYARFADYHDVAGARLKALTAFVNQLGGGPARSLWHVDTGPMLERELAQRAGLGFIGKHTNLISRRLGNWFFLAEIITTLELPPDAPEKNHCGSCRRCLEACPTAAITAPFQLDARRCISYLTIELKGAIPVELRPAAGNRIYGCDDCLAACPWNRFARAGAMMAEHRRAGLEAPDLVELLSLDEAGFQKRFAGTPILRAKRRGLMRNVCVALGNTGDERALPALQRAACDPEPLIAEHAVWAIGQINAKCKMQNAK